MDSLLNFSIIVPTYKEAKNLKSLIDRIAALSCQGRKFEVIIVDDDSKDEIDEVVEELRNDYAWLKLFVRREKRSLSQSVIDGIHLAQYPLIVVMDADLSHPPESIPAMISLIENTDTDMVIGSRYIAGGSTEQVWPIKRKFASKFSAFLTKSLLGIDIKDPLSGFIAIKKERCFAGGKLEPIGWKISLELLVKCHCKQVKEIPIHFSERKAGKSKMNIKVILNFFQHMILLRQYKKRVRRVD